MQANVATTPGEKASTSGTISGRLSAWLADGPVAISRRLRFQTAQKSGSLAGLAALIIEQANQLQRPPVLAVSKPLTLQAPTFTAIASELNYLTDQNIVLQLHGPKQRTKCARWCSPSELRDRLQFFARVAEPQEVHAPDEFWLTFVDACAAGSNEVPVVDILLCSNLRHMTLPPALASAARVEFTPLV